MPNIELNKDFIEYLRLNPDTINWILDKNNTINIVPIELTHHELLANFKIDDCIYKYYYSPTKDLITDNEFAEMIKTGYCGYKETTLTPYSNIIYGAYYFRSDFITKLSSTVFSTMTKKIKGETIKYLQDLKPYFKEYANGFSNGFHEFENTKIKPFLTILADKNDSVAKVFEYITSDLFDKSSWDSDSRSGFTIDQDNEIVNAYNDGQKQGYFYKAWSIILSNNNLFTPLFQEFFKSLPPQQTGVNQSRTKEIIAETFKNMDKKGWQYAFAFEDDYNSFIDLLTNFFEYIPYELPKETIKLKITCKTKVAKALGEIHKELSNENKLSNDTKYFQLIRVLSHFEKETVGDLYKALTR